MSFILYLYIMRKAIKNTYRIREEVSSWWSTYRPEYLENGEWKPTHTFSFTWRPYYTSDYDKAVECIKNHKNPSNIKYHYDFDEKEEEVKKEETEEEVEEKKSGSAWEVVWVFLLLLALWGTWYLIWAALTCTCN